MKKKTQANLRDAISRSITEPDLLKRVMDDPETLELFNVVTLGMFDITGKRVTGTKYVRDKAM